jgi:hypothetical protein
MNWNFFKKNKKIYPADLYSKEYKEEVLCSIEKDNDWSKIPIAFTFILSRTDEEKYKTVDILHKCIANLTNIQLVYLDAIFRERTSMDWNYDWENESPLSLLLDRMSEVEKVSILGLCTFHPNGYFREKSLKALSTFETGREIPFILLRCNDWVKEVRKVARTLFESRIFIKFGKEIVENLPLVFKLKNSNRDDHYAIFDKIVKFLSQKENIPLLDQGTKSNLNKVRYFSYRIMIYSRMFNKIELLNYLKFEKDPHSRLILFNEILNDININEFNEFFPILRKDKFPKIRAEVLHMNYVFYPENSLAVLMESLFDKSGSIRSMARYLLKKQNITDLASYYIDAIKRGTNNKLRGALLGLGEVGKKEHVDFILPFLQDERVGVSKAAIRAIMMLDGNKYRNEFVNLLNHEHKGVSKEATRSLQKTFYQDKKNDIYYVYQNAKYDHTKYNTAILLCSLPKWDSLQYIITFYVNNEDISISQLGNLKLVNWLVTFNRTFMSPNKEQIDCIRHILIKHGEKLAREERRQIEFCLKGY